MAEITRRGFLQTGAAGLAAASASAAERPNVLLVMTDQHRWDALGCYGNPAIRTPHIDSLAATGTRFTECWAQHPVCMPSRASIFTGRYPHVHGVRSNGVPLPRDEVTLAQVFAENGYRTGGAGKFHFIPHYPYRSPLPTMETHPGPYYGFQEFHLGEDGRSGEHWQWIKQHHPEYDGKPDHEIPPEIHNSSWTASHTIEFIRGSASRRQPFFAFCSFVDPHHSYNPPAPYNTMYKEADMPAPFLKEGEHDGKPDFIQQRLAGERANMRRVAYNRAQYYGEVSLIDDSVGRVLKALDESGLRDNTLIVFMTDHGDLLGDHYLYTKGPLHYRGCANLPLIVNWPGRVKSGKVAGGLMQSIDLFPTISELAGLPRAPGVQGRSQDPVLTTDSQDTGYSSVLIESLIAGEDSPGLEAPWSYPDVCTLKTSRWRMSYYPTEDYGELYDNDADPREYTNLWRQPGLEKVKQDLKDELLTRVVQSRDPLPVRINRY